MILQSLSELYSRLEKDPSYEIAPPGFSPQKVSFRIVIEKDGSFFKIEDARVKNARGKIDYNKFEVPLHEKRTSGIKAQFLCDKQEYLLGKPPKGKTAESALKCFEAFKQKHLAFEQEIDSPDFSALCRFLESWDTDNTTDTAILEQAGTNFGVFQIRGSKGYIHDAPEIKSWWIANQNQDDDDEIFEQCLVTGKLTSVCRLHPDIKGFKSSIALVGIQENTSYESYGRSKTQNCPVGQDVAFRYATALNAILDGPQRAKHRIYIAGTAAAFWTEKPSSLENCLADFFSGGSTAVEQAQDITKRAELERLLKAIQSGTNFQQFEDAETGFHILGLEQPNPGRFSIRFYHRSTVAELLSKLHDHQSCVEMVRQFTEPVGKRFADPEFPAIWQILRETARVSDEIPPLLGGALARSVISGSPYPEGLFSSIVRRIHADRTINYLRAATLKAVLVRNHNQQIPVMLDTESTDPAYLLGRLFSALEKTQEDALGNVNSSIRDRFYSSASATPASVFPRLLRTYQHHLSKLNGGAKVNRDRLVQDIMASIEATGFPNQMPLKKQGIFAIGYYHQRKNFFTKKETTETPA